MVDRMDQGAIPQQVCTNTYDALWKLVSKALYRTHVEGKLKVGPRFQSAAVVRWGVLKRAPAIGCAALTGRVSAKVRHSILRPEGLACRPRPCWRDSDTMPLPEWLPITS